MGFFLADEEGPLPGGVGVDEGVERVDGEDGGGHGEGDFAEDGPFGGAIDGGGFVEFAREGVEEAFEDEDGHAACDGGEDESGEGVEEAEVADEEEAWDGGDGGWEGHGGEEEEDDFFCGAEAEAREGVGGEWVDGEGGEDGEEDEDDGIEEGAAAEEEVFGDEAVIGEGAFEEVARAVFEELDGEGVADGRGIFFERVGHGARDVIAAGEGALGVPLFEFVPGCEFFVIGEEFVGWHFGFDGERDVEEGAVADGPGGVEGVDGVVFGLDEAGDVAGVVVAGEGARVALGHGRGKLLGALFGDDVLVAVGDGGEFARGEGGDAGAVFGDGVPAGPGGGGIGVDVAWEACEAECDGAHEAVVAVEEGAEDGVVARVVVGGGDGGGEHDGEGVDHGEGAEGEEGIEERDEDACLHRSPFAFEDNCHRDILYHILGRKGRGRGKIGVENWMKFFEKRGLRVGRKYDIICARCARSGI